MKRFLIILFIIPLFFTGCSQKNIKTSNGNNISVSSMVHEHCTRSGNAISGALVELNYEIYYKDDVLMVLDSMENVISDDVNVLDVYEDAYKNIHKNYEMLEYYDTSIERDEHHVSSHMIIQYDKIDIDQLIQIEGEEDNIFENKIPLVSKWKSLAKKFGTVCTEVDE